MTHWKLTLAYDGTPYRGWQVQPTLPTVQGFLADAIYRTVGECVLPQGSGRTDAGVHALGQVASFALAATIPATNLQNALNRCLPPSIRVLRAEGVPPDFHARHSALRKTYEYRIFPLKPAQNSHTSPDLTYEDRVPHPSRSYEGWGVKRSTVPDPICPPTLAPFVWPCPWPLDLAALNQAAAHVVGAHDFTSFAACDPDLTSRRASDPSPSNIRTITHSSWHSREGLFLYQVTASGFLHHMVRNLVGTFVQCGAHRLSPNAIPAVLAARNRSAAGPTAPPTGLFLLNVAYPDSPSTQDQQPPTTDPIP